MKNFLKNIIPFILLVACLETLYKLQPRMLDYDSEEFLALDHGDDSEYMDNLKYEKEESLNLEDIPCDDDYCA